MKTDKLKMPGFKCQNKFYAPVSILCKSSQIFDSIIPSYFMIRVLTYHDKNIDDKMSDNMHVITIIMRIKIRFKTFPHIFASMSLTLTPFYM